MNKEEVKKPYFLKRVAAYLIDFILVMLLATAISMVFVDNTNYQKQSEKMAELTKKYTTKEITAEEYTKEFDNLNYYLTKEGVGTTIITCAVSLVYYVILCYYCHGITLGKYILKLKIVSNDDKKLNIGNYLLRSLFLNLILSNLVSVIFVMTMSKDTFVSVYPKVSSVLTLFLFATMLFIIYRKDGRGLHDLMANTKVISTKEAKEIKEEVKEEKKEDIVEAKVIEEKKTTKTTKKEIEKPKKTAAKKTTTKKTSTKTGGKK